MSRSDGCRGVLRALWGPHASEVMYSQFFYWFFLSLWGLGFCLAIGHDEQVILGGGVRCKLARNAGNQLLLCHFYYGILSRGGVENYRLFRILQQALAGTLHYNRSNFHFIRSYLHYSSENWILVIFRACFCAPDRGSVHHMVQHIASG